MVLTPETVNGVVVVAQFTGGDLGREFEIDFKCDPSVGVVSVEREREIER
jgi:hypothetical protein